MSKSNNTPQTNTAEQDANLQFIVLLNLTIEKVEFLEEHGYIYGSIKQFLKNGKKKFEEFITRVFKVQDTVDGQSALDASNKLLVMQERVEKALLNNYIITVDERRQRARDILNKFVTPPYNKGDDPLKVEVRKEMLIDDIIVAMAEKNLFNF